MGHVVVGLTWGPSMSYLELFIVLYDGDYVNNLNIV